MKKIFFIGFFFIFVSQSIADEMTINSLLKEGYKIKDDRFISRGANRSDQKVVTLIKGKNYVVCTINVSSISGPRFQKCIKP
tara:strand:+ start:2015 stop:2260 length:246 start_codon:yes stop_codon:yes gene_type:complete